MKSFDLKKQITASALVLTFIACQRETSLPENNNALNTTSRAVVNVSPNSLGVATNESFYGIYTSSAQWQPCTIQTLNTRRFGSGSYVRLLTDVEKDKIGNNIDFRIELYAAYDEWDRVARSWYIKVPKGSATLQSLNPDNYTKTSVIHYTTPYFAYSSAFNHITYTRNINSFAYDIRDKNADVYIGYEIGANPQALLPSGWENNYCSYPGFRGSIFIDTKDSGPVSDTTNTVVTPLLSRDIASGQEITTVSFNLSQPVSNASIRISMSGHGAQEEGRNRNVALFIDNQQAGSFNTKVVCTPYSYYDNINPYGAKCAGCTWRYPYRNWCQGGEVAPRTVAVGNLSAGTHTFKIDLNTLTEPTTGVTAINGYWMTYAVLISEKGAGTATTGVRFYQNSNYGGAASQLLAKGNYTLAQLQSKGFINDWASSVKVPSGWTVTLYEHDNFTGTSWTVTGDNSWLGGLSPTANDKASSVRIQ